MSDKVCAAFGVPFVPFQVGERLCILPHPSGLCRLWNESGAFDRARAAVAEFAPDVASLLGTEGAPSLRPNFTDAEHGEPSSW